jgi:hypothetical protein
MDSELTGPSIALPAPRSGGCGGPDPTCRAVDAASVAVPFGLRSRCACGRRRFRRLSGGSDVTGELTGMKKLGKDHVEDPI